jgi:parvulin-like peptidyl-prolyl isomerase
MKSNKILALTFFLIIISINLFPQLIEEIYAVVNDEIITYSELFNAKQQLINELRTKYKGKEFEEALKNNKQKLLDRIIEYKLILSKAKEKKYDVENDIKVIIKEIKKQNNFATDKELEEALKSQGLTMAKFKEQQKINRIQQRFIYEEAYSNVKIDNSDIMEYYKKNIDKYTIPLQLSINCLFLNRENYNTDEDILEKKDNINSELNETNFKEVAKKYSELSNSEDNIFLGNFKKGELDNKIEEKALKLKNGEHSSWIETDSGWYIIQLISKTESKLIEYKKVREEIKNKLMRIEQEKELINLIERLKKESYIKIYKEF